MAEINKPKVFITQVPHTKDKLSGQQIPTVNINPAYEHGEIVVMMPPRAAFYATNELVRQMKEHLKNYNFERGDSIVALGDPAIIGVAFAILGQTFGKFTVLKWDKNLGRYIPNKVFI
ncbi:MAG TPA: hypothetical protein VFM18_23095 [Methanosarcina sp.]|nr:hypothetical protein [Methanosarcina sp.]